MAPGARAQVLVWGPGDAILRSGDACTLYAGAATAAELAWDWRLQEADGGSLAPGTGGRALYTAPFVTRTRTFTVRASVASDRRLWAELELRVEPHAAMPVLDRILGPGWSGPRLEPLAGHGGLALGEDGRPLADPHFLPRALIYVDHPSPALTRRWLFVDQRSHTLRTLTEDGRIARFAGRELRQPVPGDGSWPPAPAAGTMEAKGRPGPLDGPRDRAQFSAPLALAIQPAAPGRPFRILVTEAGSAAIRCVDAQGSVGTFAGALDPDCADGDCGRRSEFLSPWGLAAAADGSVYVADSLLRAVFRIAPSGVISTLLERATEVGAGEFRHLALDEERGLLYVTDGQGILKVTLADGKAAALTRHPHGLAALARLKSGRGAPGPDADCALGADFGPVNGLTLHRGLLFITEQNGRIRIHDPVSGCDRLLTRPPKPDRDGPGAGAARPRFGPLRGGQRAFPGNAQALGFNDRGIGLVGAPDCLAELYLGPEELGNWRCPWGTEVAADQE
jgi:hypothetical protein